MDLVALDGDFGDFFEYRCCCDDFFLFKYSSEIRIAPGGSGGMFDGQESNEFTSLL